MKTVFFTPITMASELITAPVAMIQMYDTWVQAVDRGELTGVCMLDMSAAFDVVNHSILLSKLELYGFEENTLKWMKNYLSDRRQAVYIDGALSTSEDWGAPGFHIGTFVLHSFYK